MAVRGPSSGNGKLSLIHVLLLLGIIWFAYKAGVILIVTQFIRSLLAQN